MPGSKILNLGNPSRVRVPTARRQREQIQKLAADGLTKAAIAVRLGVSQRSVFRVLSEESPGAATHEKT